MDKLFDLRFVIGSFFLLVGILLLGYSFFAAGPLQHIQAVNRWCGGIFIIFGIVMILFTFQKDPEDDVLEKTK